MKPTILKHVNPFLYSQESPWHTRLVGLIGLLSSALAGYGMLKFLNLNIWYQIIFGPIVFLLFYNHILKHAIRVLYPNFSKKKHLKFILDYWKKNKEPNIAIFLPYCGEDIKIFSQTVEASYNIEYTNKKIYILDDKGVDPNIKKLATKFNAVYLSRPNKGEYKKSGNLQYGWDHSTEEFAMVFDADFVPIPQALRYTVPYIVSNPKIGILQTPQYFEQTLEKHSQNEIEFGGGNIVEEFYSLDQVSRDRFDAAICVGTSAIYRREAIMSVGGTPKVNGTEDVRTGLSITKTGYKVKYIPLIISIGTSPDTLQDYFRQHNRWCTGSIKILMDYYIEAKLSFMGRLIYLMNPIYYISEALVPILLLHFIILFAFHAESLSIYNSLYFVPKLMYEMFFMPVIMRNHRTRRGTRLAAMNNIFAYFFTIFIDMPSRKGISWHPAGVSLQGVSDDFRKVVRIGVIFSTLYIGAIMGALIYRREYLLNIQAAIMIIWLLYSSVWYMLYIFEATKFLKQHDIKYQNPYNLYLTKIRHLWAYIKHFMVPTMFLILFMSTTINMYALYRSGNYNLSLSTTKPKKEVIIEKVAKEIIPDIPTEVVKINPSEYTFFAEYGDGVTHLARKAMESYTKDNENIILSAEQRIFVETTLKNIYYKKSLEIGESVTFESSALKDTISQSNKLTPDQIKAWGRYIK